MHMLQSINDFATRHHVTGRVSPCRWTTANFAIHLCGGVTVWQCGCCRNITEEARLLALALLAAAGLSCLYLGA